MTSEVQNEASLNTHTPAAYERGCGRRQVSLVWLDGILA
ncbi:hypothetical protein PSHT_14942 [Puccinia striiformis]|uniref:Uncharacterized protein n=1 Tax=Puccinia striiformis TaxID=27350 RepID=A0A2S4UHM3_9BASI|nr:hypothetical protein PSHT_14942 [Puccinia striiformis]